MSTNIVVCSMKLDDTIQNTAGLKRAAVKWSRETYAASGFPAVSTGALEVLLKYLGRIKMLGFLLVFFIKNSF